MEKIFEKILNMENFSLGDKLLFVEDINFSWRENCLRVIVHSPVSLRELFVTFIDLILLGMW